MALAGQLESDLSEGNLNSHTWKRYLVFELQVFPILEERFNKFIVLVECHKSVFSDAMSF